jgi:hypothetical protein
MDSNIGTPVSAPDCGAAVESNWKLRQAVIQIVAP